MLIYLKNISLGALIFTVILVMSACSTEPDLSLNKGKKAPSGQSLNIHINQVAFDLNVAKSAIISSESKFNLSTDTFALYAKDNRAVYTGKLVKLANFTQWQQASREAKDVGKPLHYYQADFSPFNQSGKFTLVVSTSNKSVRSPAFLIEKNALFKQTTAALLDYFTYSRNDEDYSWQEDQHIRIFGTDRFVDVSGGWNDAGGDTGKYLSHLSYANFFNPQQLAHVGWALGYSYQRVPELYQELGLTKRVIDEVFWGADYLHRILDPQGYFYMTVFDQWNTNNAERVVTAYVGADGVYTKDYQSAFRQGAGSAIAALARAYLIAKESGLQGQYSGQQYLADAEKAFHHLQDSQAKNNRRYCDDGVENIIDDYTALLAATELFRATKKQEYLIAARARANNLAARVSDDGWFISNNIDSDNLRPFYHAAEAGFPVVALSHYLTIETQAASRQLAKTAIKKNLKYQLAINSRVANPFNYARQSFKTYKNGRLDNQYQEGFFIPHANETQYWWQGESARLSSLTTAAIMGVKAIGMESELCCEGANMQEKMEIKLDFEQAIKQFSQNQLDWTLGRNPYDLSMLNGFGVNNPVAYAGLDMVKGGISNGITGAKGSDDGTGIEFGPETDWHNWRWVEQWLPHSTWFLLATTELAAQ
jgi:hypothetical protein